MTTTDSQPAAPTPSPPENPTVRSRPVARLIVGALLVVVGAVAVGFAAGWEYRDRQAEPPAPVVVDVAVDRPVLAVDGPVVDTGEMPNVVGLSLEQARQVLADVGISADLVVEVGQPYAGAGGAVIEQSPAPGQAKPDAVTLTYSQATAVPEMVGARADVARDILAGLGVRVETTTRYVAGAQEGIVLASTPSAGEVLPTELTIEVAEAAASVFLADLRATTSACRISDLALNGINYVDVLACEPGFGDAEVIEYVLNRQIDEFTATVGLADRSAVDAPMRFEVLVDGVVALDATLAYGQVQEVRVAASGALRLTLRTSRATTPDRCCDVEAVWADARLSGGEAAVQRLFEESNS